MAKENILLIEDDEDIQELIRHTLTREGYRIETVGNGESGLRQVRQNTFDCILLDLMLPGLDGLETCRLLKKSPDYQHIPIIFITAKGEEADIVAGLELGADDYIVKPFSPRVLVARLRSLLRRNKREHRGEETVIHVKDFVIHPGRHEVTSAGKVVDLTHMEFRVLQLLASRPGWVFTRSQIIDGVRDDNYPVTDRSVDVIIVGLRKKLAGAGDAIETIRGVGYKLAVSTDESDAEGRR